MQGNRQGQLCPTDDGWAAGDGDLAGDAGWTGGAGDLAGDVGNLAGDAATGRAETLLEPWFLA